MPVPACHAAGSEEMASQPGTVSRSLRMAVAYLAQSQLPDGEFQTEFCVERHETADGHIIEDLVFDSSPFVTSLVVSSLGFAVHLGLGVEAMMERGCRFLEADMDPGGLWRYWSRKNDKRYIIPPDLDDTACISHLLATRGIAIPDNRGLFFDSRDSRGRFYTWLYTANSARKWLLWWRTRGKAFSYDDQIWQWTGKDDVCAVVNANVVLYLGESQQTRGAIEYLMRVIREGSEEKEIVFYANAMSLYYMLSRDYYSGIAAFGAVKTVMMERIQALQQPDGSFGDELSTGMAICSLLNMDADCTGLERAAKFLTDTQRPDGSWRRIPMYGGPPVPTTFGSADLTTAFCLEALARFDALQTRR